MGAGGVVPRTPQLHAHAGTVTPTALVAHEQSHSSTRVPTQAPQGGGSVHGHRAHAAPGPSVWGCHDVAVGTCGGHAWRDGPGWMLGYAARIWGSHGGEGISQAPTVHT